MKLTDLGLANTAFAKVVPPNAAAIIYSCSLARELECYGPITSVIRKTRNFWPRIRGGRTFTQKDSIEPQLHPIFRVALMPVFPHARL